MTETVEEVRIIYGEYQNFSVDYFMDHLKSMADAIPEGCRDTAVVRMDIETSYESATATLVLKYDRPETAMETGQRLGRGIAEQERKDARDRAEYERLRAKFEASSPA